MFYVKSQMPCLPNHRRVTLRSTIVLPEIAVVVAAVSAIAFSGTANGLWIMAIIVLLLHTLLFYRLGRIAERKRSDPAAEFVHELRERLTQDSH